MKSFIEYLGEINGRKYLTLFLHIALTSLFVYIDETFLATLFGSIATFTFIDAFQEPLERERDSYIALLRKKLDEAIASVKSREERKLEALMINYPLDTPVIYKGNDNNPYKKGKIVGYQNGFPLIDNGEKTVMCMGLFRRDNPDRNAALDKLDGIDQWNVMAENYTMKRKG